MGPRSRSSAGGAQYNLDVGSATVSLTVPRDAIVGFVHVRPTDDSGAEAGPISYTTDGTTTPAANTGIIANTKDIIPLNSLEELDNFRAIRQTGLSGEIDVEYFTDLSG